MISVATSTHKGKRKVNQDLILEHTASDNSYLLAVIDGMGGHENGEVASQIIYENIKTYLSTVDSINTYHIQKAINKSNLAIRQNKSSRGANMGATIGGVIINQNIATSFWIGDVKIFHFRNNKLLFESKPHTFINDLIKEGSAINPTLLSKYKHIVTRSIHGDTKSSQIEINNCTFKEKEDLIIVCSDGMHDHYDAIQLENIVYNSISLSKLKSTLETSLLTEATDNFSFGLVTTTSK